MTLAEFFEWISSEPLWAVGYFAILPILAFAIGKMAGEDAIYTPWNYLFATIIYLVCVPGIFAVTLNIYLFLFAKQNIMDSDLIIQWLPILGMAITIPVVRSQVNLDFVPGFGRLSGLIIMILIVLTIMWVLDRTRLWFISVLPVSYVLVIFAVLMIGLYWASGRVFGSPYRSKR